MRKVSITKTTLRRTHSLTHSPYSLLPTSPLLEWTSSSHRRTDTMRSPCCWVGRRIVGPSHWPQLARPPHLPALFSWTSSSRFTAAPMCLSTPGPVRYAKKEGVSTVLLLDVSSGQCFMCDLCCRSRISCAFICVPVCSCLSCNVMVHPWVFHRLKCHGSCHGSQCPSNA